MNSQKPNDAQALYEAEVSRFREVLAKARSSNQLTLFDLLVERSSDQRSPKEVEIAFALFGNDGTLDSGSDSGVRVYVHRLRKRIDDYYLGKEGPRLVIPKGEYRIILDEGEPANGDRRLPAWLPVLSGTNLALGIGLLVIGFAVIAFIGWTFLAPSPRQASGKTENQQALLEASSDPFKPLIAVGDSMLLAETEDQRNIQRMILNPTIRTREDFGRYLKANPESFYQLYDFNLNFAPIKAVEAAWAVQDKLDPFGKNRPPISRVIPVSALTAERLENNDIIFVGRLAQLGVLEPQVFAQSRFKLASYDRLIDTTKGTPFQGQVYVEERPAAQKDFGYLLVRTSTTGRRLIVLAGLDDKATKAVVDLLNTPQEIAAVKRKVRGARHFEAVFEVDILSGAPVRRKLVAAYALP